MESKAKILFFILFVFYSKEISPISTKTSTFCKYDITEILRTSIVKLFETTKPNELYRPIRRIQNTIETTLDPGNETFLRGIEIVASYNMGPFCDASYHRDYADDKLNIIYHEPLFVVYGKVKSELGHKNFYEVLNFKNISINVTDLSKNHTDEKFSMDIAYANESNLWRNFLIYTRYTEDPPYTLLYNQMKQLEESLAIQISSIISDNLNNNNQQYRDVLIQNTTLWSHPRDAIISAHPDHLQTDQQYYYIIANVKFPFFNFINLTIKGLSNFVSLEIIRKIKDYPRVLLIKDIRGNVKLDFRCENKPPLDISFSADYISISVYHPNLKPRSINVEMRNYRANCTELTTPLTDDQSLIIQQHIESSIASSIMPRVKIWWNINQTKRYDIRRPIRQIFNEFEQTSNLNETKQQISNKSDPITNNHSTTIKSTSIKSNKTESYDYHVLFPNITIKFISKLPYPEAIQHELPKNLKIVQKINASPLQKFHLNHEGNDIDINLHANFSSISFSIIEPNSSNANDSCMFQLLNDEDIKVKLSPSNNGKGIHELKLKKKVDAALISTMKERIIRNIKPLVCGPIDICARSVKMVDEFLLHFIDRVLKKCSLRRIQRRDE